MLDFFTASGFFVMSQGYKLLAKDQPNTSVVWQSESIRLLGRAIDKFKNTVSPGAQTFKQTLHFRRLNSWMESGNQSKAGEDLQEIRQGLTLCRVVTAVWPRYIQSTIGYCNVENANTSSQPPNMHNT